jgi:hypothetical protein
LGLATDPFSGAFAERIRQDARAVHLDTQPLLVRGADELDDAFAAMKKDQTDAIIVLINAPPPTVPLALNNRIPAFSHHKALAKAGDWVTIGGANCNDRNLRTNSSGLAACWGTDIK